MSKNIKTTITQGLYMHDKIITMIRITMIRITMTMKCPGFSHKIFGIVLSMKLLQNLRKYPVL